jgi:hypothetical protein
VSGAQAPSFCASEDVVMLPALKKFRLLAAAAAASALAALAASPATTRAPATSVVHAITTTTAAADPVPDFTSPLSADPAIPRPASTPCVVTLVDNFMISEDRYGASYNYTPPAGCTGAWAKVVLEADYAYDDGALPNMTAIGLWLKGVNLHFGATPAANEPPFRWHVERDLTDIATLFRSSGTGNATMAGLFRDPASYVRLTARLLIYPATATAQPPRKADAVFRIGPLVAGGDKFGTLIVSENDPPSAPSELASTLSLPRDIERLYLDVLALESSGSLWWTCVPSPYRTMPNLLPESSGIGGCLDGTFRETEVRIDGQAAGVAPVFPWISPYALIQNETNPPFGGLVGAVPPPRLMNLLPYRVDLTPFAGVLSDGKPHKIAVTMSSTDPTDEVTSANLSVAASLLVYRDPHSTTVSGAVTRNTLAGQPSLPTRTDTLVSSGDTLTGNVLTSLRRDFIIDGYIDTARGRIHNCVVQTVLFSTTQAFDNLMSDSQYRYQQDVQLVSKVWRNSYSSLGSTQLLRDNEYFSYPLHMFFHEEFPVANAGGVTPTTLATLSQGVHHTGRHDRRNIARYDTEMHNTFEGLADTFLQDGVFMGHTEDARHFLFKDSLGSCYDRLVAFSGDERSSVSGTSCPNGVNRLRSVARPDGSPESLGWAGWQ